jgi:hypothetical protein
MPDKKQWEHLRTLDKLASSAQKGTFRERYLRSEINKLRKEMGLPVISAPPGRSPKLDPTTAKHLPDSLSSDSKLPTDSGATHTLFDVEPSDQ